MSFRLIFNGPKSRKQASKELHKLRSGSGHPSREYDDLLTILCTQSHRIVKNLPAPFWLASCRSSDNELLEDNTYSAQDDFPVYGPRLLKLQEFIRRQQPRDLHDLWLDRRNPHQWYTLWAILVLGGFSIFLTLLQTSIAILQVYTNIHTHTV